MIFEGFERPRQLEHRAEYPSSVPGPLASRFHQFNISSRNCWIDPTEEPTPQVINEDGVFEFEDTSFKSLKNTVAFRL